jgi:branched-chain amino acid transport system substrate-binding protein
VRLLADAIERAKSAERAAINAALESSSFGDHFMPYGPTKFVNGQNTGAQPLMTQVIGGDIRVVVPREYREADPMFPMHA